MPRSHYQAQTCIASMTFEMVRRGAGTKVSIVCAPGDMWFPKWKWEQMLLEVPGIEVPIL